MAEVTIQIHAADHTEEAMAAVDAALDALGAKASSIMLQPGADTAPVIAALDELSVAMDAALAPRSLVLDPSGALGAVGAIADAIGSLPSGRTLALDVSDALAGAGAVRAAIAAIPDVSEKTVIVRYMTQASPVRPFTEGIEYVRQKMSSLPTEGSYTVKYTSEGKPAPGSTAMPAQPAAPVVHPMTIAQAAPYPQPAPPVVREALTFAPVVTINATVGNAAHEPAEAHAALARRIDRALAELWRSGRSELRRTAQS